MNFVFEIRLVILDAKILYLSKKNELPAIREYKQELFTVALKMCASFTLTWSCFWEVGLSLPKTIRKILVNTWRKLLFNGSCKIAVNSIAIVKSNTFRNLLEFDDLKLTLSLIICLIMIRNTWMLTQLLNHITLNFFTFKLQVPLTSTDWDASILCPGPSGMAKRLSIASRKSPGTHSRKPTRWASN